MDKNDAIKICQGYLLRLKSSEIGFTEAYMFGSFAKGNHHQFSDIDIAIILNDNVNHTFETDVRLMVIRKGEETLIEPHVFSKDEFDRNLPIVKLILKDGIKIKV